MAKRKDSDPTGTAPIVKKWEQDFRKRYSRLKGQVSRYIDSIDKTSGIYTTTSGYVFGKDVQATIEFMNFLNSEIDRIIRGLIRTNANSYLDTDNWMRIYIDPSYLKGVREARSSLIKQGLELSAIAEDVVPITPISGALPALASGAGISKAVHVGAIQNIYQRDYSWLEDSTKRMSSDIRVSLTNGIQEGKGITKIAKDINEKINIGYSRARLIARTETAHSYQTGSILEAESLSDELGEELKMEWVATLDSRVRPSHLARHGKVYDTETAKAKINESPWNCRCSLLPVTMEEADSTERKAQVKKEKALTQKKIDESSIRQAS